MIGNENNEIDISSFQVSNMGMCMVKDDIIEASMDPSLIRVKKSTPTHYIPEVFYKYKNYNNKIIYYNSHYIPAYYCQVHLY